MFFGPHATSSHWFVVPARTPCRYSSTSSWCSTRRSPFSTGRRSGGGDATTAGVVDALGDGAGSGADAGAMAGTAPVLDDRAGGEALAAGRDVAPPPTLPVCSTS